MRCSLGRIIPPLEEKSMKMRNALWPVGGLSRIGFRAGHSVNERNRDIHMILERRFHTTQWGLLVTRLSQQSSWLRALGDRIDSCQEH